MWLAFGNRTLCLNGQSAIPPRVCRGPGAKAGPPYDIVIVKWEKSSGVSVQNIEL